jgi:hypothetical protein
VLVQPIRGALNAAGPAQADIGAAGDGMPGNQFQAIASLVNAE